MNKKRCLYCGKVITNRMKYCNDKCRNNYDKFEKNINSNLKIFGVKKSKIIVRTIILIFGVSIVISTLI